MSAWVWDTEADGLLDEATKIHCACFKELGKDNWAEFSGAAIDSIHPWLQSGEITTVIGHNVIGYDLALLKKLLGISYNVQPDCWGGAEIQIIDTLRMSQRLNPDRMLPGNLPERVLNPVTGKKDIIGPHSLLAWAYRVNGTKPRIDDWRGQPLEVYLHRCREDCLTTEKVFNELMREMR